MTDIERERISAICEVAGVSEIDDLSDGFHTFRQLYYQRMILFATIVRQNKDKAWKSLRHEDGELCFGGGWFIVGIDTPEGSYTYHYEDNYYSLFDCEELERGKHWDGHTEKDVIRLLSLQKSQLSQQGTTSDLISKKAAIETISRMMPKSYTLDGSHPADEEIFRAQEVFVDCIEALEILPSAQPATNCSEIPNGSDDTISRRAAIDVALEDVSDKRTHEFNAGAIRAVNRIKSLPSAQPDRDVIDDCLCHIYKNISVHTATGGVIAIRYYMEKLYEEIYGEGKRPWWMK